MPTVATPTSADDVVDVLRAARSVVPKGRGTKLSWGLPVEPDVVLDVSRMDRVLDHQPGDLIVHVEAGATLASVQDVVGRTGQRLALDETVPGGTIGGILATNASGPTRMHAGTARDLLIGVTIVRADGVVAKAGGRVVKNVAGYDLGKLVIGSFGTLAVITEAVFRLHPLPEAQRWVTVEADDLHDLAHAVIHSQAVPWAVEVDGSSLTVLVGGRADGVEARTAAVQGLIGGTVSDQPPAGWATYPWVAGQVGYKLTFALSGLRDVLATAADCGVHVRGSAGVGVVYGAADDATCLERLRAVCALHGGSVVVLEAPDEVKRVVDVWGPVPALDLMRRVKQQFDPDRRLSPGRFVGGI